ncbi:MAG: hypothetical protein Q9M50_04530 [Methylococcales bacterium]|nr:hypothetical protein [Methylococcales bacterium]
MTLTIETLRKRATKFVKNYANSHYEMGEAQNFIRDLCEIFNLNYRRSVRFEARVKKLKGSGRIDAFFPSLLLVEMKSEGKDLDKAYLQATDYFHGLKNEELPRCVLVSDFQNLHLYNQENKGEVLKIKLAELPQYIESFRFITGYEKLFNERQERINKDAAEKMAGLHDVIKATGYNSKDLETYLVRLLFCLFADNTNLFGENTVFLDYLKNYTQVDGENLHERLQTLFKVLNQPTKKRLKNLPEHLAAFPYINGSLFEGALEDCYFDEEVRTILIECCELDWSEISPAIFGSLFQAIMHFDDEKAGGKTKKRREFGAHYTSEENILKTIDPLFMDALRAEFEHISPKGSRVGKVKTAKLAVFHQKLAALNFFDPACGCGNFLIVAYRELRLLELDVIHAQFSKAKSAQLSVETLIKCDVDQFHGIDIDGSAVNIATVAMWLTDHQMNLKVQELGNYFNRIPLVKKANIVHANALQIDWKTVIAPEKCSFIMGNPPFVGYKYQTKAQKADCAKIFKGMKGAGVLDLVTAWHVKAARYIQTNNNTAVAFVSTNSLTQGEQVAILWTELLRLNIRLYFAHRTFRWSNEGKGVAAVHCVIMGFGLQELESYRLFDYGDNISGEPIEIKAQQINPYLVDASTIFIEKRRTPLISDTPKMTKGTPPSDDGNFLLSQEEAKFIKQNDSIASKYIRQFLGAAEFINNLPRYCLWLKESTVNDRLKSPEIKQRTELVKKWRLESNRIVTNKLAETPYLFGEIRQTDQPYLLIPVVSSETRRFIPIGYINADVICGYANFMMPNASLYNFGLLCSTFHNAWMRAVCGRLESRYRYSNTVVYNNYPFPENLKSAQIKKIETAAQQILDARKAEEDLCAEQNQKCSLAMLYAKEGMPADLVKAHNALDKVVDAAYGYKGKKDDAARVAFLFERYQELIDGLE